SPAGPRARAPAPRRARTRAASSSGRASELPQDAEVVFPEHADVRDPVPLRGDPVDPETPGEAGPLSGVVVDVLEHGWVDDACAPHLEPARVLAEHASLAAAEEARDVEL